MDRNYDGGYTNISRALIGKREKRQKRVFALFSSVEDKEGIIKECKIKLQCKRHYLHSPIKH